MKMACTGGAQLLWHSVKLHACGKSLRFYPPQLPPLEATALTSAAFSSDFDLDTSTLRYLLK